ncbi:MAG: diguanylate cyclase [Thermodesulfobacteriota bacterium]
MARILIIDDSALVAHVAKGILDRCGHEVLLAADGPSGLELAAQERPDLILLDVVMPGMNGYQVCEQLKAQAATPEMPIIMLTSRADPADKVRGLEIGASDYVTKPFDEGELVARVNTHLKIRELYESLREKNRQLQELVNRDGLTGLYNHRFFQETAAKDFQKAVRYQESLSCTMLDIDYFKTFNDTHGHQVGDTVLRTLGGLIRSQMRETDLAARYGGEEFALLLYRTPAPEAFLVADRLRQAVADHAFRHEELTLAVTISVGVATFPHPRILDARTLIECADQALYQAKDNGRNRVVALA